MTDNPSHNATELPDPGDVPVLDWIAVDLLDVEELYQRPEDEKRVNAIVHAFAWSKFGALVVTPKAGGRYNVIDGQHRAQAAKLHPLVEHVPAVIITAENIQAEAAAFIGVNGQRKNVNQLDLFFAKLAADDEEALTLFRVCSAAKVDIAKFPKSNFKPRQTIAVSTVQALIVKQGEAKAREILSIVGAGNFAPITGTQIKAVEALLTDPEFASHMGPDDLRAFIAETGASLDGEAKRFAATHGCPLWKGLASVWFQKSRKRRSPVLGSAKPVEAARIQSTDHHPQTQAQQGVEAANPHARTPPIGVTEEVGAPRVPVPPFSGRLVSPLPQQRNVTASVCGDPPAGRSALDQRRAGA